MAVVSLFYNYVSYVLVSVVYIFGVWRLRFWACRPFSLNIRLPYSLVAETR
jgi:hypothetical protein